MARDAARPDEFTDVDLMDRLARGDREAFAALFRRYQALVYRFSVQMTGSKDAAEDITQEVFIALARAGGRYNPSVSSLSTYLYGIARHMVLQRRRTCRTAREVGIEALDGEVQSLVAPVADPAEQLSRDESIRALRRAILRLPLRYREVIVLCELNGVSYDEAARIVGCPGGTIRSRLHRARRMLIDRCRNVFGPAAEVGESASRWVLPRKSRTLRSES